MKIKNVKLSPEISEACKKFRENELSSDGGQIMSYMMLRYGNYVPDNRYIALLYEVSRERAEKLN